MKVIVTFSGGKRGEYPLIGEVVRYVLGKHSSGSLFDDDDVATSCMSYYGLCE